MDDVLRALQRRLVVSCQPVRGGTLNIPEVVLRTAQAVVEAGAAAVRVEGKRDLKVVMPALQCPIIGLIKRDARPDEAIITATRADIRTVVNSGAQIVAFEATARVREAMVEEVVTVIHERGLLAMADVSTVEEGLHAWEAGADLVGTTLSGYTPYSTLGPEPDLELVGHLTAAGVRVMAEGRLNRPEVAAAALAAGAFSVTVGSAITRPEHVTEWFVEALERAVSG